MSDTVEAKPVETMSFEAEVSKLLKLMIHSLYSNEEIFLRELISNAADAIDKLRFESLHDENLLGSDTELQIKVSIDQDEGTITISDNGIGMSREEVIENLGTIAKSGTAQFLEKMSGDKKKDSELIGQFGVGFYSSFIVADKVSVKTLRAAAENSEAVLWESDGVSGFSVGATEKETRGTEVCLKLKADCDQFLNDYSLRQIISKYGDHLSVPVMMPKAIVDDGIEGETDEKAEEANTAVEYEAVNQGKALWLRSQSEIKDEEYIEFYHHVSHDFSDPLKWSHNKVEGKLEYTSLLYLPSHAPFDLYNREAARGLKLYVQRVFIMDDAEQFLPLYLRFVKGVVDSSDLDLNVSREILQNSPAIASMRSALVKRVLNMLDKMAKKEPEEYLTFWKEFGDVLKEGIGEDIANKDKILDLLRMHSTVTGEENFISLADYVARMKEGQEKIYYLTADGFDAAMESPHLEVFKQQEVEVLVFGERIDDWMMGQVFEYEGKSFQHAGRGELDLPGGDSKAGEDKEEKDSQISEDESKVLGLMTETLGEKVESVKKTSRLVDSPACLVLGEQDIGVQMRQMLEAAGQKVPEIKPVLEVNLEHKLLKALSGERLNDELKGSLVELLFDEACLAEGGHLKEPGQFIKRLNRLMGELV